MAQTVSTVQGDLLDGSLQLILSPVLGKGNLVVRNSELEEKEEVEFNPFVSLAPFVEGMHLFDWIPRLFKPILFVDAALHSEVGISPMLVSGELHCLEGIRWSLTYSWLMLRQKVWMSMWKVLILYILFLPILQPFLHRIGF